MKHRRAGWIGVALALTSLAVSGAARAQEPDKARDAKARFIEGRAALERGDVTRAYALFQASYALNSVTATLLNLASCEEKLGKLGSAWSHFGEALAQIPTGDNRLPVVRERMGALKGRVPWLRIDLAAGAPEGTQVLVDDRPLAAASLGVAQAMDPGSHEVVVTTTGRPDRRYAVDIAEGQSRELVVAPSALPDAPVVTESVRRGPNRTILVAGGAVGVAAAIVGVALRVVASGKAGASHATEELGATCGTYPQCKNQFDALQRERITFSNVSTVSLVGAAAVLTGIGTYAVVGLVRSSTGTPPSVIVSVERLGVRVLMPW